MGICCIAQETNRGSVSTQKGGMGRKMGGRWEGGSKGRGYMYIYGWFMLRSDRKQQNSIKQLSFNKKRKRKENMVYMYYVVLLSHKNEWDNAICSHTNGPKNYNARWSKSDRERQISYDITYMLEARKLLQMNLFIKQK